MVCTDSLVHYPRWQHNMVLDLHHLLHPLLSNRQKHQKSVSPGNSQRQRHHRGGHQSHDTTKPPATGHYNKDHNTHIVLANHRDSGSSREKDNRDIFPRGTDPHDTDKTTQTGSDLDINDETTLLSNATTIPATHPANNKNNNSPTRPNPSAINSRLLLLR